METRTRSPGRVRASAVERATPNDLTTLASDRGAAPMNIAAVLVVDGGSLLAEARVARAIDDGAAAVPRLRERLRPAPFLCGRPYWVRDDDYRIDRHLDFSHVDSDDALWQLAGDLVCRRLPRDRPLWGAHWVTGLAADRAALVLVAHHVLADGIGGLAVLAAITDATSGLARPDPLPTSTAHTRRALAAEAWGSRLAAVASVPSLVARARSAGAGMRDLGIRGTRPRLCARTSLNRPTGPHRRISVVEVRTELVVQAAHRRGVTVNDIVLTAVAEAMGATLAERGEPVDSLVLSVPYSARPSAQATRLGNESGVVPFRIPLDVDVQTRLDAVACMTRDQRSRPRAASAAPLGVAFRGLARLGALQWFVDHQRLVNSFVTNVRGPATPWQICGHPVSRLVPVAVTPGNVAVTFDVMSYAGTLGITVVTDPDVVPDDTPLTAHLLAGLASVVE